MVTGVQAGEFNRLIKGKDEYIVYEGFCAGTILVGPKKIVEDTITEKIFLILLGKSLPNEKMDAIKGILENKKGLAP